MTKALTDVFTWIAIVVGLILAVLIFQTMMAYLRHDATVSNSYIWRLVTGLFN